MVRPTRRGTVGSSLSSAEAVGKMGEQARTGTVGEQKFQKMMNRNQKVQQYAMWASLSIPQVTQRGRTGKLYKTGKYNADVDFAIANGDTIVLVDVKMYKGGVTYWSLGNNIMEGLGFKRDKKGNKITASRNMDHAVDKYRKRVEEVRRELAKQGVKTKPVKIIPIVVFVAPGKRPVKSVFFMRWPGGIKSYLPESGVNKIARLLGSPRYKGGTLVVNKAANQMLNQLVR